MLIRSAILIGAVFAAMVAAPAARADEPRTRIDGYVAYVPLATFDYIADGHGPSQKSASGFGLGGQLLRRFSPHFVAGIGLGYEYDHGGEDTVHVVAAPLLVALRLAVGNTETMLRFGLGPAIGFVPGYAPSGTLVVLGPSAELALSASHRISTFGVLAEVGIAAGSLGELNANSDAYLAGGRLTEGQIGFVRLGATWQ